MKSAKVSKISRFFLNKKLYQYLIPNIFNFFKLKKEPVIICGCPRSGTTLLMSLLDAHPELYAIPFETTILSKRSTDDRIFKNEAWHRRWTKLLLNLYLFTDQIKPTANRWCEKTPQNILNIDEISQIYQGKVRFINIIRDGRDVVSSWHSNGGYLVKPGLWLKCMKETARLKLRQDAIVVRYEDLVTNPEAELKRIEQFLGLATPFQKEGWLDRTKVKGDVKSLTNGRIAGSKINKDINKASIGGWQEKKAPYLETFLANEECVAMNTAYGYV